MLLTGDAADAEVAARAADPLPRGRRSCCFPALTRVGSERVARVVRPPLDQERLDELEGLRFELDQMVNG